MNARARARSWIGVNRILWMDDLSQAPNDLAAHDIETIIRITVCALAPIQHNRQAAHIECRESEKETGRERERSVFAYCP